jgi:predicted porin
LTVSVKPLPGWQPIRRPACVQQLVLTYPSYADLHQTFSTKDKSMKKSLLALAVLGSFAGTASAQTSLSVYGLADAGLVRESGGPNNNGITKLTSGIQNGSRLGFKGTEDLGRGLSAKFVLEAGINIDDGTTGQSTPAVPAGIPRFTPRPSPTNRLFGRQAYVGLSGNWGNVTLGRQYTPHYLALGDIDPFAVGLAGNAANFIPTILRMDNAIKYTTPTWSGFTADLAYALGEVQGNNSARLQYGLSVGYANGPLTAKVAYHRANGDLPEGGFPSGPPNTAGVVNGIPLGETSKNWLVGAKWDFGVAAASLAIDGNKGGGSLSSDTRDYLIGVSVPFGPATFLASFIKKNDRGDTGADAKQWALGLTYAVSKRTNFYTSYGHISNDRDLTYTAGNATERGTGDKQFNVGVRHLF